MAQKRNLTIHFMDGTIVAYDFPRQVENDSTISSKIASLLDKQYIVIEGDGAIHFYPVNNIKSIQLHPVPQKLPDFVIHSASAADKY
ncbi:MAG: hypothetical protein LJE83_14455 [Gammaproteobacteria bacterium]|nr:hypothetical protein [Gammaproteobacteria bacterium]